MPLTPNAKIDRRALPPPETHQAPSRPGHVAPGSDMERLVAGIWQGLLGLGDIGLDDNFFDLGGHSLLTVRLQARIRQELDRRVPVTDLFRFPTVRTLATHLSAEAAGDAVGPSDVGLRRAGKRREALARRRSRRIERGAS